MVKALSFLVLGAAVALLVLLQDCWNGCHLTSWDVLLRWSSGTAGVLFGGWLLNFRKGQ